MKLSSQLKERLLYVCILLGMIITVSTVQASEADRHAETVSNARWVLETVDGTVQLDEQILNVSKDEHGNTVIRSQLSAQGGGFVTEVVSSTDKQENGIIELRVKVMFPSVWNVPLRRLALQIPLDLHWRKRVYFKGDYNLDWDTRYFYQYHLDTVGRLLDEPERNEWGHFALRYYGLGQGVLTKSESLRTAPLKMQAAAAIPPLVQLYDEHRGYTFFFPGLEQQAPTGIAVDARKKGCVELEWWSSAYPLLEAGSTDAKRVFATNNDSADDRTERVIQVFEDVGYDNLLSRRELVLQGWQFTALPDAEAVLQEQEWVVNAPKDSGVRYVAGGWPLRKGELQPNEGVVVWVNETETAVQSKPLAYWPDGSVKWLSLVFPLSQEQGQTANTAIKSENGDTDLSAKVTQRNGADIALRIEPQRNSNGVTAPAQLQVVQDAHNVMVDTGEIHVEFGIGKQWLKSIHSNGVEWLDTARLDRLFYIDYLIDPVVESGSLYPQGGTIDRGEWSVDKIEVLESGPLRTQLRLSGLVSNREPTYVSLYLTLYAGKPTLDVQASVEFRFTDPRRTFLTGMGLQLPLRNGDWTNLISAGNELSVDSQKNSLLQLTPNSAWLYSGKDVVKRFIHAPGWMALASQEQTLGVALRNFPQQAPSGLTYSNTENVLRVELWPEGAGPMDVRRYSEYPHRSQGESIVGSNDWIEKHYYDAKEGPFYGVSRTREFGLVFLGGNATEQAEAYAADLESRPLIYAGWERYRDSGTAMYAPDRNQWPSAWQGWSRLAAFWLFHQQLHDWHGFWVYGDIQHQYRRGYGWILEPSALKEALRNELSKKLDIRTRYTGAKLRFSDYLPNNDWGFDNGRWGWTNTEGLPNLFLQNEYMRNGNRRVFFAAEALARYSRDVVTRQSGKWFGAGTRHGVQPWSCGNHEPRQTVVTEWRPHYYLTGGEPRSLEVFEKLYHGAYNAREYRVDAAHSAVLQGHLFRWELTGDAQDLDRLKRYVETFLDEKGFYLVPTVRFPEVVQTGAPRSLNGASMFFHTFGGMHAILDYYRLTGDENLKHSLLQMADYVLQDPKLRDGMRTGQMSIIYWGPLLIAAQEAKDPKPYQQLLRDHFLNNGALLTYQPVAKNVRHWTGSTGFIATTIPSIHFWINYAPMLLEVIGDQEIYSDKIRAEMERREREGNPFNPRFSSWQSEYDEVPELSAWLSKWWPSQDN